MVAIVPIGEPKSMVQGDTVKWRVQLADYLPTAWTLTYNFVSQKHKNQSVTASDNGDGTFLVSISSTNSLKYGAGKWHYQGVVTDGTDRYLVTEGAIDVVKDFASAVNGYDARSHAEKVLEAIEAVIEGRATSDQSSMSIGGRSISLMPVEDLLVLRSRYNSEVDSERAAERIAQGMGSGRRVRVRFA